MGRGGRADGSSNGMVGVAFQGGRKCQDMLRGHRILAPEGAPGPPWGTVPPLVTPSRAMDRCKPPAATLRYVAALGFFIGFPSIGGPLRYPGYNPNHGSLPGGEGTGLVEQESVDSRCRLQNVAAPYQQAPAPRDNCINPTANFLNVASPFQQGPGHLRCLHYHKATVKTSPPFINKPLPLTMITKKK